MKARSKIILLMVTILALLVFTACGGQEVAENDTGEEEGVDKVDLSIWHNFAGDDERSQVFRARIEKFEEDNPHVNLDVQAIPVDGYRERLNTVAAANELPDVFFTYPGAPMEEFYENDLVQPITDLLDDYPDWSENFLEGAFERFTFEDEIYSVPLALSATSFLFYNKPIFEQYDVDIPKTWDELLEVSAVFNENDITPISLGNQAKWPAQSTILGTLTDRLTGTEWIHAAIDQEGVSFTDSEFVNVLEHFKQMVDHDLFQEGANSIDLTQAEQYFIDGDAAMTINGAWVLTDLIPIATEEQLNQEIGVTLFPEIPGGKGEPNTISGGPAGGLVLGSHVEGEKRDVALDLIYTASNEEAQKEYAEASTLTMYATEIDESKVTKLFHDAHDLVQEVTFTPVFDLYLSAEGTEAINNGLQELLMDGDPEEIAQKLQDAHSKAVGK